MSTPHLGIWLATLDFITKRQLLPMCVSCNEVGRRAESRFCDRCGAELLVGLPSTTMVELRPNA